MCVGREAVAIGDRAVETGRAQQIEAGLDVRGRAAIRSVQREAALQRHGARVRRRQRLDVGAQPARSAPSQVMTAASARPCIARRGSAVLPR